MRFADAYFECEENSKLCMRPRAAVGSGNGKAFIVRGKRLVDLESKAPMTVTSALMTFAAKPWEVLTIEALGAEEREFRTGVVG